MTSFHWRDELMFHVHTTIDRYGFFIQYVMGDRGEPSWGYTIGFLEHGHPEVVVIGLDDVSTAGVLHCLYDEIVAGIFRPVGVRQDDLGRGETPVHLLPVPDEHWLESGDRLCTAVDYYDAIAWDPRELSARQLVWATPDGYFPWEPECSPHFRRLQPILDPGFREAA
jgi:hypothetical protein